MNKFIILLLLATGIRLIGLNQSLWLDEAVTASVVKNYELTDIVTKFSPNDFHPPLYYLMLKIWTNLAGYSEISLRIPSVLLSLVTIYFVYLIGVKLGNKKIGIIAAALTAFNPLLIYYSQEARMYLLVTALLTMAWYFFIKKNYLMYNLMAVLAVSGFYGAIFFLAGITIYCLLKKNYREFGISLIGPIVGVLLLSPLIIVQIKSAKILLTEVSNWKAVLGQIDLKNLLLIPVKFSVGRISFYPKIIYYLMAFGWSGVVFINLIRGGIKNKKLLFYFLVPLVLGVIISTVSPMLSYFRFLYLIPVMSVILAINGKMTRVLMVGMIFFSLMYVLNPNMYREDWKSLAREIKDEKSVYMIGSLADPVKYYLPNVVINDIKSAKFTDEEITVVPYGEAIHGFDHNGVLKSYGYRNIDSKSFRELTVERWSRTK